MKAVNYRNYIYDRLICPKRGVRLQFVPGEGLIKSQAGSIYKTFNGKPLLIDFDTSIISSDYFGGGVGTTYIKRKSFKNTFLMIIKRMVSPTHSQIKNNFLYIEDKFKDKKEVDVLIIGGGTIGKGCEVLYHNLKYNIHSCDVYDSENVDVICDAHHLPYEASTFDLVIIQYVLEHVLQPKMVVDEIYRVLRTDGIVYSETPFLEQVHEGAFDYTRFTDSGHRYLFKKFLCLKSGSIAGPGTHLLWSIEYIVRGLFRSRVLGKIVKVAFFWLQFIDKLIPETYKIDAADSCYFLGIKEGNFVFNDKEIVDYYKGCDHNQRRSIKL